MDINVIHEAIQEQDTDLIVVNLFEGVTQPGGATGAVDRALGGAVGDLIAGGDFKGKLDETAVLYPRGAIPARRVLIVGLGKAEEFTLDRVRRASATAARRARDLGARRFATIVHGAGIGGLEAQSAAQALAEGTLLGLYEFNRHKAPSEDQRQVAEMAVVEFDAARLPAIEAGVRAGRAIAAAVALTRDLVNEPPNFATPTLLAQRAHQIAEGRRISVTVLEREEMRELGMGALLAVAQGSDEPPKFIILDYQPEPRQEGATPPTVVLVGKGITFDSGGLSIKPAEGMEEMKSDMAGGAAVMGAVQAIADLNLPVRVVGLVPATENVINGHAYKPADIVRAMNGKTIEIISTDAEGRLILADALVYAKRYAPQAVVDLATLTGACITALGKGQAAGLFSTDDKLAEQLKRASASTGERIWPLPLYDEYSDVMKSDVADLKNSGGRYSGVGASAAFLKAFAEGYPWAHLDIAPMAYLDKDKPYTPKGATGFGVRLLVQFVRDLVAA
ncbi:MAG: leucyl aminopeptidase [Chloroflexota bacterium]